jgi:4-azaleucine resistance transporter AzlC
MRSGWRARRAHAPARHRERSTVPASSRSPITAGLLLGFAVGLYAVSFGVLAVTAGLSVAQACAMSLLIFTGASQFAAVGVVQAGGSPLAAMGGALLLAARNGVYGLAMSRIIKGGLGTRLAAAQLTIDESTALSTAQHDDHDKVRAFWAAGLGVYAFWNIGTLIGALVGRRIDPTLTVRLGLDAAFPAGFVALLVPHLRKRGGKVTGLIGAATAVALTPVLPKGLPILVAAVASLVGLRRPSTPADAAASDPRAST